MPLINKIRTKNGDEQINYLALANLPKSLPASDVYPWAKQPTKPSYIPDEITKLYSVNLKNILSIGQVPIETLPTSTTYPDMASAEEAGAIDNEEMRKKYMQLFALRQAPDGTMFYDDTNKRMVYKSDGKWFALTGTEVTYNFNPTI